VSRVGFVAVLVVGAVLVGGNCAGGGAEPPESAQPPEADEADNAAEADSADEAPREGDPPDCRPTEVVVSDSGFVEAAGEGEGAETWALLWDEPPWAVDQEVKVVWRMTGQGAFTVRAVAPDGRVVDPTDGPTPHSGSTWERPGDEWGTLFSLPNEGCWVLEATRGDAVATIGLMVEPA
jgi:hypothetical protein